MTILLINVESFSSACDLADAAPTANLASVRSADEAPLRGRRRMRDENE